MHSLQDTQPSQGDDLDGLIQELSEMAKAWKQNKPTKNEVKTKLDDIVKSLSVVNGQNKPDSPEKSERVQQQSFYGEFAKGVTTGSSNAVNGKGNENGKGKGKTSSSPKGTGKGKPAVKSVPRLNLSAAFPSLDITSWQQVRSALKEGKEPSGAIAICDSSQRISELQALTKVHNLKKQACLIAMQDNQDQIHTEGKKAVWLPFHGNIALVQAIAACARGVKPEIKGETPKKVKLDDTTADTKRISLRITAVLEYQDKNSAEKLKAKPALRLRYVGCTLHESRTYGWNILKKHGVDTVLSLGMMLFLCSKPMGSMESLFRDSNKT